jgi:hypothetical protein
MGSIPAGRLTLPGPFRRSVRRPLLDGITGSKGRGHLLTLTSEADAKKRTFGFDFPFRILTDDVRF